MIDVMRKYGILSTRYLEVTCETILQNHIYNEPNGPQAKTWWIVGSVSDMALFRTTRGE